MQILMDYDFCELSKNVFLTWTIFNVCIEYITKLVLLYVFFFFFAFLKKLFIYFSWRLITILWWFLQFIDMN